MSALVSDDRLARSSRLSALVSEREAGEIQRRADLVGLSVSAYLRECALGGGGDRDGAAGERVDEMIARLTETMDVAVATLDAALARLSA